MATTTQLKRSSLLHITLWIVQVLLAAMFLAVGLMKTATPIEELAQTMPLAGDMPILTRFIGVVEILGGLGLILPAALRIIPKITAWAAAGLALIMIFALIFHLSRGEMSAIGTNMVLVTLAGFVAWGRATKAQILARAQ